MKIKDNTLSILVENLSLKDYVNVTKDISELEIEIERLNNIINELEKYLIKMSDRSWDDNGAYDNALDKLKELKGGKNG